MARWLPLTVLGAVLRINASAAPPSEALELRNQGLAHLENERPAAAQTTYRSLIDLVPDDPLGHANLAVTLLRQQRFDEADAAIAKALQLAPDRGDLLSIQASLLVWSGRREEALSVLRAAHQADPENLESLYSLYRHASAMRGPEAEAATNEALMRLRALRPENLFVLLKAGQRAIATDDRAAASSVYLRIRELTWQVPGPSEATLASIFDALEEDDLGSATRPARVLENLFMGTPLFSSSLGEIFTNIQGIPVAHFVNEDPPIGFGAPVSIHFAARLIDDAPSQGSTLVVADLDGDGRNDAARLISGAEPRLQIRLAADDHRVSVRLPAALHNHLHAVDLDNDGRLELLAWGKGFATWRQDEAGTWSRSESRFGLAAADFVAVAALDYDMEGDLDLAVVGADGSTLDLYRNSLEGPLEAIGNRALPRELEMPISDLLATDVDRDGDLDLLGVGPAGVLFLDNLRQGRFGDRTAEILRVPGPAAVAAASADLDNDGWPELALVGDGLTLLHNNSGTLQPWEPRGDLPRRGQYSSVRAFDADNDGRLDLALAGEAGLLVLTQPTPGMFIRTSILGAAFPVAAIAHGDLDGDGDLDLLAAGREGLFRLENIGGHRNGWLAVRLQGLNVENQKNNFFGIGSAVEVFAGPAYQFREANEPVTHFGLGSSGCPEVLRVTWINGIPQNRLEVCGRQRIVEEQVLKGSCPFLYAEGPNGTHFVTDLLWGAPLGMPIAEGAWATADIEEWVAVEGATPGDDGHYRIHITEELWEAAYFDYVRLRVVDHPHEVRVASSLRIVPGETIVDRVLATANVRPVTAARDGEGRDVSHRVRHRDEVYADGYPSGPYQGVTPEPWMFSFDLGAAPGGPVRLLLDGWIFPADASLNLAIDQRRDKPILTRLEMKTQDGWRTLIPKMGHPAGKTKTMVIDTPPLPAGVRELRIVTSKWLHWDRIAWSTDPVDGSAHQIANLAPVSADLHFRGFSRMGRKAPNGPHDYDYEHVTSASPWLALPGNYTRYGNVRELLLDPDDRHVILAPGDELSLVFDASSLPPPPAGTKRSVFLESHGWDKDADRNTWEGHRLEPLPFRAQSGYPWAPGETYPDTPELRRYRDEWLTRRVERRP